jgi:hypothetical protein
VREERAWIALLRHAALLARTGQLRFRLETFGVYYPHLPYSRPAWRISPRVALLLVRQSRRYAHWLLDMQELRRGGPGAWWERRR